MVGSCSQPGLRYWFFPVTVTPPTVLADAVEAAMPPVVRVVTAAATASARRTGTPWFVEGTLHCRKPPRNVAVCANPQERRFQPGTGAGPRPCSEVNVHHRVGGTAPQADG